MENKTVEAAPEKGPVFKSAMFGGFERQSVLNYIYETVNSTQEAQERLNTQIGEMTANREKLEQSVKDLEGRLVENEKARTALGEELHSARQKNTELSSMLATLNQEIDRQKGIVKEKDEALRRVNQVRDELEQKNAQLEQQTAQLIKGQDELERSKLQIGELMLKSHMEADNVLSQATAKAQEVIAEANVRAGQIEEVASKASSELGEQLGKFRDEISTLEHRMEEAFASMREKFTSIGEAIDKGETQLRGFSRPAPSASHIVLAPPCGEASEVQEAAAASEFF